MKKNSVSKKSTSSQETLKKAEALNSIQASEYVQPSNWAERELDRLHKSFENFKSKMPRAIRTFYESGNVLVVTECNETQKLEARLHLQTMLKLFS